MVGELKQSYLRQQAHDNKDNKKHLIVGAVAAGSRQIAESYTQYLQ